jgi:hypothetical protein
MPAVRRVAVRATAGQATKTAIAMVCGCRKYKTIEELKGTATSCPFFICYFDLFVASSAKAIGLAKSINAFGQYAHGIIWAYLDQWRALLKATDLGAKIRFLSADFSVSRIIVVSGVYRASNNRHYYGEQVYHSVFAWRAG